jgi:CSLREA domain-containing protein
VLAAVLVVLVCALAAAPAAQAELFTVDSTGDAPDAVPGNEVCLTADDECTLRAAIEESNASVGEFDEIDFEEEVFEGQAVDTIVPLTALPALTAPGRINGRECPTESGVGGPCVGIDGPGPGAALIVDEADEVEIEGLAVSGAGIGISVEGSKLFKVRSSWFGIELDGVVDGGTTGILIGPESNSARIGGEGPDAGNVLAGSTAVGLQIHGADDVKVLGNYFGVKKDGITPAANGEDIEVTSVSLGGPEATGTAIGTTVGSQALATPACDGGCNLISGAASNGIDLEGDGGAEAAAAETTIAGNYIGLDAAGTASIPNAFSGIHVGAAAQTVVGGPKAGDANRVNGGGTAVLAGPDVEDLVVQGNLIGVDTAGTGTLAPPGDGVVVDSEGLSSLALEAMVLDNEIRMEGGVGISQQGFGAKIAGNEIHGAETGIETHGSTERGNLIEGNSIKASEVNGILLENGFNELIGNQVAGTGGSGILIEGSLAPGVTGNLIGGDAVTDENTITGSGGDAIEIVNLNATANEVARNRGSANFGLFIDLVAVPSDPEPGGPNGGIQPPVLSSSTQASADGSAKAGARVRVFRKQTASPGELDSFLGEATADAGGNWKVAYPGTIPPGTIVAAAQTDESGATSELTTATTGGEAADAGSGAGGSAGAGAGDDGSNGGPRNLRARVWPRTKIVRAPKRRSRSTTVRFRFKSDKPGSRFLCKLDRKPFDLCRSPKRYEDLGPGRHVFQVRAIDPAGKVDPSPAKRIFVVLG